MGIVTLKSEKEHRDDWSNFAKLPANYDAKGVWSTARKTSARCVRMACALHVEVIKASRAEVAANHA